MDESDRAILEQMRRYARQAVTWASAAGSRWTDDPKTVAAVAQMVGQVGEAARRASTTTRAAYADVPWAEMAGMRNRIYHDYGQLDERVLRETVRRDLRALVTRLDQILVTERIRRRRPGPKGSSAPIIRRHRDAP